MKKGITLYILLMSTLNGLAQHFQPVVSPLLKQPVTEYCGVINEAGEAVVPFIYAQILPFAEGVARAAVMVESPQPVDSKPSQSGHTVIIRPESPPPPASKWGLIDAKGDTILPFVYSWLKYSGIGNRYIACKDERYGVIDRNGDEIIPFKHKTISVLDGMFLCREDKIIILDSDGEVINGSGYDDISADYWFKGYVVKRDGKKGILDGNFQETLSCSYDDIGRSWEDGLLAVAQDITHWTDEKRRKTEKTWGFIDKDENLVIPYSYRHVYLFEDGVARVETDKKRQLIDTNGNVLWEIDKVISGEYGDKAFATREAFLTQDHKDSFKSALVTKEGRNITPFEYEKLVRLDGAYFLASKDGKDYGVIDNKGKTILPFEYRFNHIMKHNNYVWLMNKGKFGAIDLNKKCKTAVPFRYDNATYYWAGLVEKGGKWGIIDYETGKESVPAIYDTIVASGRYYFVCLNGKWGIFDSEHKSVIEPVYDSIEQLPLSYWYIVTKSGKTGVLDQDFQPIVECSYDGLSCFPGDAAWINDIRYLKTMLDGKFGAVDVAGNGSREAVPCDYHYIDLLDDGYFRVVSADSHLSGVVNDNGADVIPCLYKAIESYSDGLFVVREKACQPKIPEGEEIIILSPKH